MSLQEWRVYLRAPNHSKLIQCNVRAESDREAEDMAKAKHPNLKIVRLTCLSR